MSHIKSFIFLVFLNLWGTIIPIIYAPAFIFNNSKLADHGAKVWAKFLLWILKKLCRVDYKILGLENLPKNEPVIIACKHQSAWETIVMHLIVNRPVYVYKKELEKIPFYGWYLKVMSGIKLNRKGGASALKSLIKQSKNYLEKGQNIIIFPQGTRVPTIANTEKYPYQSGIAALYLSCGVKVIPAALDSGVFWPKHKLEKKAGTITIKFLPAINPGLKKEEFLKKLEEEIEKHSNELLEKSR
jgi:1-acyl-sn-glycerol-3-phosphate acyltransferase